MSETASPSRRGRLLRIAAALVVLLAVAGYLAVQYLSGGGGAPRCVVRATDPAGGSGPGDNGPGGSNAGDSNTGAGTTYVMTPEQAANAATISAVGTTRGLPERAVTIALATALQESALRNLDYGDRDSLGLFQQRPSKGWGTPRQILDPVYSAGQFYDHLAQVPDYTRLPLTEAAQRVQRSGFPLAYAKHEPDAALLAAALTGRSAASLTCSAPPEAAVPGDPEEVRAALVRSFGAGVRPADADAGVVSVPVSATAGTDPAADTVADPAPGGGPADDGPASRRGWELAHWAVAQAAALRIDEVVYAGRVWSAKEADRGWRRADGAERAAESGETAETADAVRMRTAR